MTSSPNRNKISGVTDGPPRLLDLNQEKCVFVVPPDRAGAFEIYRVPTTDSALGFVQDAFASEGVDIVTESNESFGTFVRSIAGEFSTEKWYWAIVVEEINGFVKTTGIDGIKLDDVMTIGFIAEEIDEELLEVLDYE